MQAVDEDVAAYATKDVILCTDQYGIYNEIDDRDGIDAHLAIKHDDHFALGDAHVNHCENRHRFLRSWLRRFRSVSKHYLQQYLDFFALLRNDENWFDTIVSADVYT